QPGRAGAAVDDGEFLDPPHLEGPHPFLGVGEVVLEVVGPVQQFLHTGPHSPEVADDLASGPDDDQGDAGHAAAGEVGELDGDDRCRLGPGQAGGDQGAPGGNGEPT